MHDHRGDRGEKGVEPAGKLVTDIANGLDKLGIVASTIEMVWIAEE